jgi:hypothetical protein
MENWTQKHGKYTNTQIIYRPIKSKTINIKIKFMKKETDFTTYFRLQKILTIKYFFNN